MVILTVTIKDPVVGVEEHFLSCNLTMKDKTQPAISIDIEPMSTKYNDIAKSSKIFFRINDLYNIYGEFIEPEHFDFEELMDEVEHISLAVYSIDTITLTPVAINAENIIPLDATIGGIDVTDKCSIVDLESLEYADSMDYDQYYGDYLTGTAGPDWSYTQDEDGYFDYYDY